MVRIISWLPHMEWSVFRICGSPRRCLMHALYWVPFLLSYVYREEKISRYWRVGIVVDKVVRVNLERVDVLQQFGEELRLYGLQFYVHLLTLCHTSRHTGNVHIRRASSHGLKSVDYYFSSTQPPTITYLDPNCMGIGNGSQNWGRWGPASLGCGVAAPADTLLPDLCHRAKFGRSRSNRFDVSRSQNNLRELYARPLKLGACLTPRNTLFSHISVAPNFVTLG